MWQRKKTDWTYNAPEFYERHSYETLMEEMNDMKMEFVIFFGGGLHGYMEWEYEPELK